MNFKLAFLTLFLILPNFAYPQKNKSNFKVLQGPFHVLSTKIALVETPMIFDSTSELYEIPITSLVGINCKTKKVIDFGYRIVDPVNLVNGSYEQHANAKYLSSFLGSLCKAESKALTDQISLDIISGSSFYTFYPDTLKKSEKDNYLVWLKVSEFENTPVLDTDGKPMKNAITGETIEKRIKKQTSKESKHKIVFNCESPSITLISLIEYNESGKVVTSDTFDNMKPKDVVPDSIGESIVKKLCMLK